MNSVTNIIQELNSNRQIRMVETTITNEYQSIFKLYSKYNYLFMLRIEFLDTYSGDKYLNALYKVKTGPNGTSFTALVEYKDHIDVQFIDGDTRYALCQIKSNTTFTRPSKVRITEYTQYSLEDQSILDLT